MEHRFRLAAGLAAGLAAASASLCLTSCTIPPGGFKFAEIHYSQLGACAHAQLPDGTTVDAPASHAIVLFRINNIDNTTPDAGWVFNPGLVQVNSPSDPQANLGSNGPPVTVPAHATVAVNRPIGIMVETANADGTDAATYKYMLLYPNTPPAPGTLSVNDTLSVPRFPFNSNCNALLGG